MNTVEEKLRYLHRKIDEQQTEIRDLFASVKVLRETVHSLLENVERLARVTLVIKDRFGGPDNK